MICLLEMGLLALDTAAWNTDRRKCLQPVLSMALHRDWLLKYRVRLHWSDEFFNGFPWNQPNVPPELIDYCRVLTQFHSQMQANGLLITQGQANVPPTLPAIIPDLTAEPHLAPFRATWLSLLGTMVCDTEAVNDGIAVPTWEQPLTRNRQEITIQNVAEVTAYAAQIPMLKAEAEWQAFIQQYHKPDLTGIRVAVLGGERASFERAKQRLMDAYNVADCRRLPPHYEENRSQQQTQQRLSQIDLLVICANRLKHSDTGQIRNIEEAGSLSCAVVTINSDSAEQIVQAVVNHYRAS